MRTIRDSMIPLDEVPGHKLRFLELPGKTPGGAKRHWCSCSCGLWEGETTEVAWGRARWQEHLVEVLFGYERLVGGKVWTPEHPSFDEMGQ